MKRKTKKRLTTLIMLGLLLGVPAIAIIGFGITANVPIPILPETLASHLSIFDEINVNFTVNHQNEEGIFVEPSVEINYHAQEILTNVTTQFDETIEQITTRLLYMMTHKNLDGGFSEVGGTGNVITTYQVLRFLYLLNSSFLDDPEMQEYLNDTVTFINNSALSGGYALNPNSLVVTVETTYFAAMSLVILNRTDLINNATLAGFLTLCHNNTYGGFFTSMLTNDTNIKSTHYGMELTSFFGIVLPGNDSKFIEDCQNVDGGFGSNPNVSSDVESTYHAIMGLRTRNQTPANLTDVRTYLKSAKNLDGGYGARPGEISEFSSAFQVVLGLNATNDHLSSSDEITLLEWMTRNHALNGLFGYESVRANYWALTALQSAESLNRLNRTQKINIANFVKQCQINDGGFTTRIGQDNSTLFDTFCAVHSLSIIQGTDRFISLLHYLDSSKAISYLRSFQNPDGGFRIGDNLDLFMEYVPQDYKDMLEETINENISISISTYWAFSSLLTLGTIPSNLLAMTLWLKSLQNADGGFGATTGLWSEVVSTYYVIKTFSLYSENINSIPSAIEYLKN
ncbi:MAG: prenyltransferase/squalene oxidase repeat-containing protein, partial [Promethearchaeota archaeon]